MPDERVKGPGVICSGLIEKDGKFLIFMCPRFRVWRAPGGRADFRETLEEALIREIGEETGIEVKDPRFLGYGQDHQYHHRDKEKKHRLIMFFHVRTDEQPQVDPDEADEHKWVTLEEMKAIENKEGALTDFFNKNPGLKL